MGKIDAVVIKETKYIFLWTVILSALLQAVFLVMGIWDYTVLLGNLLTGAFSVLNFFLMGISVQKALGKDEKEAKGSMKISQVHRNIMLFAIVIVGMIFPVFNRWAVIIPLFFTRIAVGVRPLFDKKQSGGGE